MPDTWNVQRRIEQHLAVARENIENARRTLSKEDAALTEIDIASALGAAVLARQALINVIELRSRT